MTLIVKESFYHDSVPEQYIRRNNTTVTTDITDFLKDNHYSTVQVNAIVVAEYRLNWSLIFDDPHREILFRLRYADYIQ